MGGNDLEAAEIFLSSFNRIEKYLQNSFKLDKSIGFTNLVRKARANGDATIAKYEDDLIQIAQLRNAIVHESIAPDFIIAQPNQWIIDRILTIEKQLYHPKKVGDVFCKKVVSFEQGTPLLELLKIASHKKYSQFPLHNQGKFVGVITLRMLGYWFSQYLTEANDTPIEQLKAKDILTIEGKKANYQFVGEQTLVADVLKIFHQYPQLEVIFVSAKGKEELPITGVIRPRDLIKLEESEN